ncbi:1-deoxy-D-xylulose-5-phosphate synthase [Flavobacteriaceae bacterium]|nr:1-deoxy-D-xylulose-5-phosphate synthase [Flavobacteriaceae bacterium]
MINNLSDIKNLSVIQLKKLADELRQEVIQNISQTGGHLGASLGVIELTIALHHVFDSPNDKIIWDVGHQSHPHKILTGRRDQMKTMRQPNGLSGFTKRAESEHDVFGAGHSSTSISAALGITAANNKNNSSNYTISLIGDGAISAGMAYEALNNAEAIGGKLIVILNDNEMSISPAVGAMSRYFSKLVSSKSYLKTRKFIKNISDKLPESIGKFPGKFEKSIKDWWIGGNVFETMGFFYIGPVDGHDVSLMTEILKNVKNDDFNKPILIHCITQKGHGYNEVKQTSDKLHAVAAFDIKTGLSSKSKVSNLTYSQVFGQTLTELAKKDDKIMAITAAMPSGTGLDVFTKEFPQQGKEARFFDVGIAEQHAVTFAAGLATEGFKPFVAIYSTFLQRAYDQIIHDVAIQNLPVRFMIDRAGFVGADGPTHAGSFDVAFLANVPNFIVMAPANEADLIKMVKLSSRIDDCPVAIRYPRKETKLQELNIDEFNDDIAIGKGKIIHKGKDVAILSYGAMLENSLKAKEILQKEHDINPTIADARFCKPLDVGLINKLIKTHDKIITIEEGVIGGFGSIVTNYMIENGWGNKIRCLFMKDKFIEQNSIDTMRASSGISAIDIIDKILK